MSTLIPAFLLLVLVAGFVTFLVVNSTRRRGQYRDDVVHDEDASGPPGIGPDETPLGDTAEHAGEQTPEGETVGGQDAPGHQAPERWEADRPTAPDRQQRDPVGGEAEGKPATPRT
jgi:hypothetical protein